MLRRSVIFPAVVLMGIACSSDSDDDFSEGPFEVPISEVTPVALDKPVGAQRAEAWTVPNVTWSPLRPEWAPAANTADYLEILTGSSLVRRRPGSINEPLVWFTDGNSGLVYDHIAGTSDGGALGSGLQGSTRELILKAFDRDGKLRWDFRAPGMGGAHAIAALTDGGGAVVTAKAGESAPGSIPVAPDPNLYVILVGPDGKERSRTAIEPLTVPFPGTADPAYYKDGASPGRGSPTVEWMSAAPDGGVAFVGGYGFRRVIRCGSEFDDVPDDATPTSKCAAGTGTGLVGRIDGSGKVLWLHVTGRPYRDLFPAFRTVAVNADGSVLAAGMLVTTHKTNAPPVQAIAMRFDAGGHRQWSKSIPFGEAPGELFQRGLTRFDTAVPREDGAFDVIFEAPKPNPCRLLRLDASGAVTRVQLLRPLGPIDVDGSDGNCSSRATGKAIMYTARIKSDYVGVRLADD